MAGKIFINYRRGDEAGFTQALYLRLESEFASGDLFMDVEGHIKPGDDFVEVLNAQVAASDVVLAVIGPRWAELLTARQGEPDDLLAIELKAALDQGKRVIPVLVGGASMPRADSLPEAIRPLARRNALGLRPERFKADCQGLVTALKESLAAAEQERAARTEAERKAAEAARLEAEEQAAARAKAAEERGRTQAMAGLSAEDVRKAEELASWDFVKDRNDVQELRDHLARFPSGTTERYALARLDGLVWSGLGGAPKIEQLRAYLDEFPKGANVAGARGRIAALEREATEASAAERLRAQETEAWGAVAASTDKTSIEAFLKHWPKGQHAAAAKARIAELRRGPRRRAMLLGATAMTVTALIVGGWLAYSRTRLEVALAKSLSTQAEQALKPGSVFKECQDCPEMVVVPAGKFAMGSRDSDKYHSDAEGPQHEVAIAKPFAVSRTEVTFAEWDACVAQGGCARQPEDQSWGRGGRPVMNVSWDEARQYAAWIAKLTGKPYRLLTEAEWEYAARAGTTTIYSWGDEIGKGNANCAGCGSQSDNKQTAPVGSFKPNAFGLYDMHGNVWEWVEDCWHVSYRDASSEGSAWTTGCTDGSRRVIRGGSWFDDPQLLRAAFRLWHSSEDRNFNVGFRLARTLNP
jgi:formylglycine-generating enzyme required for sulfatase activity